MQILRTGDVVRARGRTWRVTGVHPFEQCRHIELCGTGTNVGASCELLVPFDQVEQVATTSDVPRRVGTSRWRRAARALVASSGAPGLLQTPATADIAILPYQLEPVVSVLRGNGCRILLADEVGLGKTIQACLLTLELRARAAAARVLILAPPGLRAQWRHELEDRFRIDAAIVDTGAVRRRTREIPADLNPWTTWRTAIASIDYVKRPEVLRLLLDCRWDLVVIDEAHRVANDGDRRNAASALTSRATYVVLLTATPHSGDQAAFESLCDLGKHDDSLLIFRRTRQAATSPTTRRVHRLYVRSSADERRMHARFEAFARAVRSEHDEADRDMWIALAMLKKRSLSSARALHISVSRRLDALAGAPSSTTQLRLPLDEDGDLTDADDEPAWQEVLGLQDVRQERRLLSALADAAAQCARHESKIAALRRLLRRIREPLIIFTEYRDTLAHLARELGEPSAILHGGLVAAERAAALETFLCGRRRLLLATDAAAEGLNLHHTCRTVINLELPWNPMRLEQRIGRVDRIGQTHTVHAFHLIGADSGELRLLGDLRERVAYARAAIGAPDPLDGALAPSSASPPSDRADVDDELRRIHLARTLGPQRPHIGSRPLVAAARNRHTRARLNGRKLTLWECTIEDADERPVASRLVAVAGDVPNIEGVREFVRSTVVDWSSQTAGAIDAFYRAALRRNSAIAHAIATERMSPLQPGLFDRRAQFAHAALQAAHDSALTTQQERTAELQRAARVEARPPRLRLVLLPRS